MKYIVTYLTDTKGRKSRKTMTVEARSIQEAQNVAAEELYLTDAWQILRVNEYWEGESNG